MVDSVKNYGIAGVKSTVELGKTGNKIVGTSDNVALHSSSGELINANIGDGIENPHSVSLQQLRDAESAKILISKTSVNYDSGEVLLLTLPANSIVLSTTVEKGAGNWTNFDSSTEITVGDSLDNSRLFSNFDPTVQSVDETNHVYTQETAINAYVTAGRATAGSATITIMYSAI